MSTEELYKWSEATNLIIFGISLTLGQMIQFIRHPTDATFLSQRKAFCKNKTPEVIKPRESYIIN